jgi:cell division protein FtsI (penicillin-binding protein 3)
MPTPRTPGSEPRRRGEPESDRVVVPLRRTGAGGLGDARRYRPRGRTVREAADPADASRRADRARRDRGAAPELRVVDEQRGTGDDPPRRPRQPSSARTGEARTGEARTRPGRADARRTGAGRTGAGRASEAGTGGERRGEPGQGGTGQRRRTPPAGEPVRRTHRARQAQRSRRAAPPVRPSRRVRPRGSAGRTANSGRGRRPGLLARLGGGRPPRRRTALARLGSPGRRLRLGTVIVLVLFTILGGRLVQLQLTDAQAYAAKALAQRLYTTPLPATRGEILDRTGAVLAHSVTARYVFADPVMVKNRAKTAAQLSPILGVPASELQHDMRRTKLPDGRQNRFVYLARGVDLSIGDAVEALNLPGIGVSPDEKRDEPGHDLAANIIGFTGYDGSGLTGLEAEYNSLLAGSDGELKYETGRDGQEIPDGYHYEKKPVSGGTVQLTVDSDIQYKAQQALYDKLHATNSDMGAAVVLDVKTGQVLAQASYPTYDAANPDDVTQTELTDWASQAVVEPGSIHKVITLGAALQEGVISPDSVIPIHSTITKGGTMYQDSHWHDDVGITVPGILAYSSNVGTITVADKLGAKKLYEYQRKFGLGTATGEGMPGEASGIVRPPSQWYGADYGSIPIGLGVAVTPIQMAAAYAAIANDGEYVQPHLIDRTVDADGTVHTPSVSRHRVLSPSVAAAERKAMVAVTTVPDATGVSGAVPGYQIAAKTGTGQRYVNGKVQQGNIESFIGMAPANHPRYVVAVFAHTASYGEGANMGPVFKQLMSFVLAHEKVPPTDAKTPSFTVYK